jgi:integrase/recombinase XerD
VIKQAFRQFQYPIVPLHADLALKERALARTKPPDARPGRYRAPDKLLTFLEAL